MFTGLIEDVGIVESVDSTSNGARLGIATTLAGEIEPGDSVAVSGACPTATGVNAGGFEVEAMNQTLGVTTLGEIAAGDAANLELAMKASDRFGGHIVQGHVDGVGEVTEVVPDGFAKRLRVALGPNLMRYVIPQGSITLDGVSLTVAEMADDWAGVSLIPETLERTNLGEAAVGRKLNVECDLIGKHVERLLAPFAGKEQT